jgi:hypothetical protein
VSAAHPGVPAWPSHADVDHHDDAQAEAERQPREHAVSCCMCQRGAPQTWNTSGLCDRHQDQRTPTTPGGAA